MKGRTSIDKRLERKRIAQMENSDDEYIMAACLGKENGRTFVVCATGRYTDDIKAILLESAKVENLDLPEPLNVIDFQFSGHDSRETINRKISTLVDETCEGDVGIAELFKRHLQTRTNNVLIHTN